MPTETKSQRRQNPPKRRKKNERRKDMQIVVSASQGDIYAWALSLAIMAIIITAVVTSAILKGAA